MSVGLHIMTPTSVAVTGTSATINPSGAVEFVAITNLELRGVFSSTYDDYVVVMRWEAIGGTTTVRNRFLSGTTPASGSDYVIQNVTANGTSVTGTRFTSQNAGVFGRGTTMLRNGVTTFVYGPHLTQPTAQRFVGVDSTSSAQIGDDAGTHSLSTSYDGLVVFPAANTMTGKITVYGYAQ